MRYIQKGPEPGEFANWKAQANEYWKPAYTNLSGKVKSAVYDSLLVEQGHICCYCERELKGGDYHIEHLNPQFLNAGDELNYSNFLCSCLRSTTKGAPLHCGKLKDWRSIPVHPFQADCQSKFEYTAYGEINGVDAFSDKTIEVLGLNIGKLIDMRKNALVAFLTDDIDNDEFSLFVKEYLTPTDGRRNAFSSMIEFLFKDILM